jgi:hypothetical protein
MLKRTRKFAGVIFVTILASSNNTIMKIDERLLGVFIPCTEQEAPEVYELLERAGLSTERLPHPKSAKLWMDTSAGVECYHNGTFQAFDNIDNRPTLTLDALRDIVGGEPSLLEEIDEFLERIEGFIHGEEGDAITELRRKIERELKQ